MSANATHRISGLAKPVKDANTISPTERYQNEVLANPLLPFERFDAWAGRMFGLRPETYPPAFQDVKDKMETYITSMGFGNYVTDRNRPEVISDARRRGIKVVSTVEGAQLQSIMFDAITRALYADSNEAIYCIKAILYYINSYLKNLFAVNSRYSFFDVLNKTQQEKVMYASLLHLFTTTCNPALQQRNLPRVDFPRILASLPSDEAKANLTRAYASVQMV